MGYALLVLQNKIVPTTHTLTLIDLQGRLHRWDIPRGANLRLALLRRGFSPYTRYTRRLNCSGRGLCATCGVWITENAPAPEHWHDKAAQRFGYPRLSCQIKVESDMTVQLVKKWVWGGRKGKPQG
jgi:ferredoxin